MFVSIVSEYLGTAAAKGKWTMVNETNKLEPLVQITGPQFLKLLDLILLPSLFYFPNGIPFLLQLCNLF